MKLENSIYISSVRREEGVEGFPLQDLKIAITPSKNC